MGTKLVFLALFKGFGLFPAIIIFFVGFGVLYILNKRKSRSVGDFFDFLSSLDQGQPLIQRIPVTANQDKIYIAGMPGVGKSKLLSILKNKIRSKEVIEISTEEIQSTATPLEDDDILIYCCIGQLYRKEMELLKAIKADVNLIIFLNKLDVLLKSQTFEEVNQIRSLLNDQMESIPLSHKLLTYGSCRDYESGDTRSMEVLFKSLSVN